MKQKSLKLLCIFMGLMLMAIAPGAFAGVNFDVQHTLTTDNSPLDVVASPDGKYIFVLTNAGNISVYDQEGVLQNKIHVGEQVDQIRMAPQGDRLFVASRLKKTVQVITLDFFVEINTADAPAKGPQNAPVVLAIFSDFQCPYCARLGPELEQVFKKYPKSVKIVFKNFPLSSHKFAKTAAAAALAAECQGKFWEFHDELFKHYRNLNDQKILEIAKKLGLNEEQFEKDRQNPLILEKIKGDYEEGQKIGVNGIPAVFMNGRRVENRDLGKISNIIEKELERTHKKQK